MAVTRPRCASLEILIPPPACEFSLAREMHYSHPESKYPGNYGKAVHGFRRTNHVVLRFGVLHYRIDCRSLWVLWHRGGSSGDCADFVLRVHRAVSGQPVDRHAAAWHDLTNNGWG